MDRAQCLVTKSNKILLVKHRQDGTEWFCLPGGGIEKGKTPIVAAARELREECLADGANLRLISSVSHDHHLIYTFYAEIGEQEPALGEDQEKTGKPILAAVEWRTLDSICERDRAYMWAAGLFSVE